MRQAQKSSFRCEGSPPLPACPASLCKPISETVKERCKGGALSRRVSCPTDQRWPLRRVRSRGLRRTSSRQTLSLPAGISLSRSILDEELHRRDCRARPFQYQSFAVDKLSRNFARESSPPGDGPSAFSGMYQTYFALAPEERERVMLFRDQRWRYDAR